jgi:hypothetical protein
MQKQYGTIDPYFSEGLGVGAEGQRALKKLYLSRP